MSHLIMPIYYLWLTSAGCVQLHSNVSAKFAVRGSSSEIVIVCALFWVVQSGLEEIVMFLDCQELKKIGLRYLELSKKHRARF